MIFSRSSTMSIRPLLPAAALLALGLGGCAANPTVATSVAAVEVALTAADQAALQYVVLPLCTGTNGPLCSSAAISAKIKADAQTAYNAVMAARNNESSATLAAASAAIAVLTADVPAITTGG
jgi:hypothetical protein